ncbi:phosphohydrolase [Roseibium alexandrii]|uniref:phosphohydrolase n=1 Tax=Roseibium alexandrii TaxID=388408 RepID=UPI0037505420
MTWIHTFTGRRFTPLAPKANDVSLDDIAHALSMKCRYNGHCSTFYSVAEHSVLVASKATPRLALRALMHDAHEAYLVDLAAPLKGADEFAGVCDVEKRLDKAIAERFNLPYPIKDNEIDRLDKRILLDEGQALMHRGTEGWNVTGPALGVKIQGWPPHIAKAQFKQAFIRYSQWHYELNGAA